MPDHPQPDENLETVRRVQRGDVEAFGTIMKAYGGLVTSVAARRVPADSVRETVQDVFVRAYRALPSYTGRGPFKPWLMQIAARTCHDFWRERYRSREVAQAHLDESDLVHVRQAAEGAATQVFRDEQDRRAARELLRVSLDGLSPKDRTLITLVEFEGHSLKEAAALMGWGLANVKVSLFRARRRLRERIEQALGMEESEHEKEQN